MPQNPLFGLQKASSISGPPPDQSIDPRYDPATGEFHADPNWRNTGEQSILGPNSPIRHILNAGGDASGAALGGLSRLAQVPQNIYNFATQGPNSPSGLAGPITGDSAANKGDDSTPPPSLAAPPKFTNAPYQPDSRTVNDFNLPKTAPVDTSSPSGPVYDPLKGGHMNFGGPATQPGDLTAIAAGQAPTIDSSYHAPQPWNPGEVPQPSAGPSSFDQRYPGMALEGLQQARQHEFEDHADQYALASGSAGKAPVNAASDLATANVWQGKADRYKNDLANPTTPLNKIRAVDSANTAAQQEGFGIPEGQPQSPTQAKGAFARMMDINKVNSPVNVANIDVAGRADVANKEIQASKDRGAIMLQMQHDDPFGTYGVGKSSDTYKPGQIAPGAAKGGQAELEQARKDVVGFSNPMSLQYLSALAKFKAGLGESPDALKTRAQGIVDQYSRGLGMRPAPTVTGVAPGGSASGGVPPELQNLQPGQKATDSSTGETWVNRNGQIQRIQ